MQDKRMLMYILPLFWLLSFFGCFASSSMQSESSIALAPSSNNGQRFAIMINNNAAVNIDEKYRPLATWLVKFIVHQTVNTPFSNIPEQEGFIDIFSSFVSGSEKTEKPSQNNINFVLDFKGGIELALKYIPQIIDWIKLKKNRVLWRQFKERYSNPLKITKHGKYLNQYGNPIFNVQEVLSFGFGAAVQDFYCYIYLFNNEERLIGQLENPDIKDYLRTHEFLTCISGWIVAKVNDKVYAFFYKKNGKGGEKIVDLSSESNIKISDMDSGLDHLAILYSNGTLDLFSLSQSINLIASGRSKSGSKFRQLLQSVVDFGFFKFDGPGRVIVVKKDGSCTILDAKGDAFKLPAKAFVSFDGKIEHIVVCVPFKLFIVEYENGATGIYDQLGKHICTIPKGTDADVSETLQKIFKNATADSFQEPIAVSRL